MVLTHIPQAHAEPYAARSYTHERDHHHDPFNGQVVAVVSLEVIQTFML